MHWWSEGVQAAGGSRALVRHYVINTGIVTISPDPGHGQPGPVEVRIQVNGADTVLAELGGNSLVYRRPRCRTDPRFNSGTPFMSACS